jgi:hypothetical protein
LVGGIAMLGAGLAIGAALSQFEQTIKGVLVAGLLYLGESQLQAPRRDFVGDFVGGLG